MSIAEEIIERAHRRIKAAKEFVANPCGQTALAFNLSVLESRFSKPWYKGNQPSPRAHLTLYALAMEEALPVVTARAEKAERRAAALEAALLKIALRCGKKIEKDCDSCCTLDDPVFCDASVAARDALKENKR